MDRLDIPDAQWTRVSPKYVWPELIGYLVTGLIVAAATAPLWLLGQWWTYAITAVVVVVTIVGQSLVLPIIVIGVGLIAVLFMRRPSVIRPHGAPRDAAPAAQAQAAPAAAGE